MTNKSENFNLEPGARLRILGLMAAAGILLYPAKSGSDNLIPFCKDLRGYSAPKEPPFMHGKKADGKVICDVDGDTFDVRLDDGPTARIRLWGIDCAESNPNEKCMKKGRENCADEVKRGKKVSQEVRQILSDNKRVTLEGPYKNDGKRLLAYIRIQNGIDLGRELVSDCLCRADYDHKRKQDYRRAADRCKK